MRDACSPTCLNGGIRFHTQLDRVTPQVKAHLSVLLAVLALVQAGQYWLSRYELTFSTRGTVDGATYTDVNVELRAIYLLMLIALFAIGLFIANIWRRGWVLPGMAVGLWVLVAVLAGGVVPAFVQRFRVEPTESSMETDVHRQQHRGHAGGLRADEVDDEDSTGPRSDLTASTLRRTPARPTTSACGTPTRMQDSYRQQQEIRPFYAINDVDIDRYGLDGEPDPGDDRRRATSKTSGMPQASWEATPPDVHARLRRGRWRRPTTRRRTGSRRCSPRTSR